MPPSDAGDFRLPSLPGGMRWRVFVDTSCEAPQFRKSKNVPLKLLDPAPYFWLKGNNAQTKNHHFCDRRTAASRPEVADWPKAVGQMIAQLDCVLVCGGLGGAMEAAAKGAKRPGA